MRFLISILLVFVVSCSHKSKGKPAQLEPDQFLAISLRFKSDEDYLSNVVGEDGIIVVGGESPDDWGHLICQVRDDPPFSIGQRSVATSFSGMHKQGITFDDSYTLSGESSIDLYLEVGLAYDHARKTVIIHKQTIPKGKVELSFKLHELISKGQTFIKN